jgi:soluble lytic murein transglycosylase-like protein
MSMNRLGWVVIALVAAVLFADYATARPGAPGSKDATVIVRRGVYGDHEDPEIVWYARRYRIPLKLARTIWVHAREVEIDPGIVFGLIATESRFDPRAVGREGERGLMQIKLATARAYDRRVTADALLRPDTNLRLGLRHLKQELEHFDHDWRLGLLAYNMGRTRVTRALARGSVPETGYVAAVLAHSRERPL